MRALTSAYAGRKEDVYKRQEWKKAHYDKAYTRAYTTEVVQEKHGVKITSHAAVVAEIVQKILDVTITWKIEAAGKIDADIEVTMQYIPL